ncbi:MAG: TIGR03960 family B12-binding radical SAM protein [Solirubrobacterales bacterium]
MLRTNIEKLLPTVTKPARYTGAEMHSVVKEWSAVDVRMLFAFPDVYEVGMSHLGAQILYGLINQSDRFLMERAYAPWPDMEAKMREQGLPLYSLESFRSASEFDVVGFSLQTEMSYSNVLNMLDLGGIPLRSADRRDDHPLIVAGGPNVFNPEPLADFIDVFVIGDGEETLPALLDAVAGLKQRRRNEVLTALARIPGLYVPSLYEIIYREDGTIKERRTLDPAAPDSVSRAVVADLETAYYPERPLVPYLGIVHDRAVLEVMRGCQRGCRFCQAGMIYRPLRERKRETLTRRAAAIIDNTGFDEISLASLSSADYSGIRTLARELVDRHGSQGVGIALPSLRVDAFSVELAGEVQRVRKTTLTFAPEAGSQRLRDVINKNVNEAEILQACKSAFSAGWQGVKLYFMLGLPTETDADLDGIIELLQTIKHAAGSVSRRPVKINASLSFFVPKPHTPFQWFGQAGLEEMKRKRQYLWDNGRIKNVKLDFHSPETSYIEGILARGDRRLGRAIEIAWKNGARFDSWTEYFSLDRYLSAMAEAGLEPAFYNERNRDLNEILPWDFINTGIRREFFIEEWERALRAEITPDCREESCSDCGVCQGEIQVRTEPRETAAGGDISCG